MGSHMVLLGVMIEVLLPICKVKAGYTAFRTLPPQIHIRECFRQAAPHRQIRSDEGLAYSARSSYRDSPWGYGLFTGSCQTRSDAAMRALTLLIEQIEKMKTEGPSAEEVANARDAIVNQHVFEYESSSGIVNRMVWFDITGQPLDTIEREFAVYQAVELEDVQRAGSEYLHPGDLTILVVGNQELFDRPLSDFGEVNVIEIEIEEVEELEEG